MDDPVFGGKKTQAQAGLDATLSLGQHLAL
jgi:hypothetical protein